MDFNKLQDSEKEFYRSISIELLGDLLYCTKDWSAWKYGTMSENDFINCNEDDDIINTAAEIIYKRTNIKDKLEYIINGN